MLAVVGIIVVVFAWRFLVLTAAQVFENAGLPPPAATFQARSALTGSGYTTGESEIVVNDPAAREAASMLFIIGFVGPVTILGLLGFGFLVPTSTDLEERFAVLVGLIVLFLVLERVGINARILGRPAALMARVVFRAKSGEIWVVVGDHAVASVRISPADRLADRPLGTAPFEHPNVTVLGVSRVEDNAPRYIPHPSPDEMIVAGDELILYGPLSSLTRLTGKAT